MSTRLTRDGEPSFTAAAPDAPTSQFSAVGFLDRPAMATADALTSEFPVIGQPEALAARTTAEPPADEEDDCDTAEIPVIRYPVRKRRDLSPAMLLSLLPVAVLPADLRRRIFRLVVDVSPGAATYRTSVTQRAEPLGADRSPAQRKTPSAPRWRGSFVLAAVMAVAALALLGGAMLYVDYIK